MKAARIHGPDDVRLDDVEEPRAGADDVVLAVGACGICGSDVGYARLGGVAGPTPQPMPIGHELAGTVVEVGDNCRAIARVGDRVALHPTAAGFGLGNGGPEGGFTPRLLVRGAAAGRSLFPIPDDMSFDQAALAEPLGVGMHAVDQAEARPGDRVAVFGAGGLGAAAISIAAALGAAKIFAVDVNGEKARAAEAFGAVGIDASKADPVEAILQRTGDEGVDVALELVGLPATAQQAVKVLAVQGRAAMVGLADKPAELNMYRDLIGKEREVIGVSDHLPGEHG